MITKQKMFKTIFKKTPEPKNGKWKEFNKHAVLIAEGNYLHDRKHGLWKEYYDTGELMIEEVFERGIQHGRFATYHKNGLLLSEGKYVNGQRDGHFKVYNELGQHIKSMLFIKNNLIVKSDLDYIIILITLMFWIIPLYKYLMGY
jgi:antitoxin component YwqK of YwqJK toxin-antitoxin module